MADRLMAVARLGQEFVVALPGLGVGHVKHVRSMINVTSSVWPDTTTMWFVSLLVMALLGLPIFLGGCLWMVWSLAHVHRMHKALSAALVVVIGVPLYIVGATLLILPVLILFDFLAFVLAVVGPVATGCVIYYVFYLAATAFVEKQASSSLAKAERAIARDLVTSEEVVREAWQSLKRMTVQIGRAERQARLLTEDYLLRAPEELVVGLTARTLLDVVERSPPGELLLPGGLRLVESRRPRGALAEEVWAALLEAQATLCGAQQQKLSSGGRARLAAALLAGGAEARKLPQALVRAVRDLADGADGTADAGTASEELEACKAVLRPLLRAAARLAQEGILREEFQDVLEAILASTETHELCQDKASATNGVSSLRHR